jgi:eukaryotic-like serine/threonine-protein kinase
VILCHQCGTPHGEAARFCPSCGAATKQDHARPKDPLIGRTIAGSYVMLELVGVGGMGRVYRAEQRMLGRTVAIKVIHPHLLSDEQSVARFYTEARAASRLNHPNSVSIIDFGRTDDGILYLVMEYLQGKDLARLMREDGPLPLPRVCEIVSAVLDALGEAHALEVVHRDLKPENVIIERLRAGGDLVKVVDFGLAKLLGGGPTGVTSITLPGLVCGTPDYMSPEQGRGEEVDARGDIYSVGVMLFELLTGRLPFIADTPTNVVLKHIQEAVPDPRAVAPTREIPQALVDVLMRALAKESSERYAQAEDMARELRRVAQDMAPQGVLVACAACGKSSPASKRFCAECGTPLPLQATPPSGRMSLPPRLTIARTQHPVLVGRADELAAIEALRLSARDQFVSVNVTGEAGVGRTRLLAEVATRASQAGDIVVGAGPHESGAPVAYHPLRTLLRLLLAVDDAGLAALADKESASQPLMAAGLREVLSPQGVLHTTDHSKVGAVASALSFAIRTAMGSHGKRIVLLVDDLHRCDGLTPQALAALPHYVGATSVLLLTATGQARPVALPVGTAVIALRGFTMSEAKAFMAGQSISGHMEPDPEDRLLVPLYITQLQGLGLSIDGGGRHATLPSRLADAVAQRIQRLNVSSRRLLQAVAVLGRSAPLASVRRVADASDMEGLPLLIARGFVVETDGALEIVHPFVRDLIEASTPAQARRQLHLRALDLVSETDAPIEVRAHHAYGAGEALSALVLLERLGDLSAARGDLDTAVLGYQRGIELARRELLESGDTSLDDALAGLSRRLGVVLARRRDLTGAEGVLREAVEYSSPTGTQRALILAALARVVGQRDRPREAQRLIGQALELVARPDASHARADVQLALAEIREREPNLEGAIAALQALIQLSPDQGLDPYKRVHGELMLAELLLATEHATSARQVLASACTHAEQTRAPALLAQAQALTARLCEDREEALQSYKRAALTAALAGAADYVQEIDRAAARLLSLYPGAGPARVADTV